MIGSWKSFNGGMSFGSISGSGEMENRRKKGISLTLMWWKNCINQLEYMDRALENKTFYEYHIGGNEYCIIAENDVCVDIRQYWKPEDQVIPTTKWICLKKLIERPYKTIGIHSFERTATRNRKPFTGTGWGGALFITEWPHESAWSPSVFGV